MARTFVIGDIHGAFRALMQCLEKAGFNYEEDTLICLGDVCDGWPETKRCVAELLKMHNLKYILGNHDTWFLKWMSTGDVENIWYVQGGEATLHSYGSSAPTEHRQLISDALPYLLLDNRLFVHAGIDPKTPIEQQGNEMFLWDRTLAKQALACHSQGEDRKLTVYDEVYVGHTPISSHAPVYACGVWLMDTGAGWQGVLSMMNIDSKETFTSDPVPKLYPGIKGRSRG